MISHRVFSTYGTHATPPAGLQERTDGQTSCVRAADTYGSRKLARSVEDVQSTVAGRAARGSFLDAPGVHTF